MMLKNNMFSRVGKLLVAGLLVVYGNAGYAQSNVQLPGRYVDDRIGKRQRPIA